MNIYMRGAILLLIGLFAGPATISAQTISQEIRSASVWVVCDGRQGSGTVIHPEKGYILTNGHVAADHHTGQASSSCDVGFVDLATKLPKNFFRATVVRTVFFEKNNQDFAILRLGQPIGQAGLTAPFPHLQTNEFAEIGDAITITGYSGTGDKQLQRSGEILEFRNGFIETDAEVVSGDSGGTLADAEGHLIGIPTRIVTVSNGQGESEIRFEHVDIRSIINWLDTLHPDGHDEFMTHADYERYHQTAAFVDQGDLDCFDVVRSENSPSVYCLMSNGQRLAFPNDLTFHSWFANFDDVILIDDDDIQEYRLTRNATFRPGTLVKSASSPKVYVVVDAFGTMRHVNSEEYAIEIWGANWASLVFDIPDEFFTNYRIGQPIE